MIKQKGYQLIRDLKLETLCRKAGELEEYGRTDFSCFEDPNIISLDEGACISA